jgi:hypothetical protein
MGIFIRRSLLAYQWNHMRRNKSQGLERKNENLSILRDFQFDIIKSRTPHHALLGNRLISLPSIVAAL